MTELEKMSRTKTKAIVTVIGFILLLLLAEFLCLLHIYSPVYSSFINAVGFVLSIGIYVGLFIVWTISIYQRIMQNHVRTYLVIMGLSLILWVSIRAVKWRALEMAIFGDRFAWYLYYIPMILIPLMGFFTALCVGESEGYRPDKRWNLLYIPAVFFILLVLTNDVHKLVFVGLDTSQRMYGQEYNYGIGYSLVMAFVYGLIAISFFIITKKFTASALIRKLSLAPLFTLAILLLYNLIFTFFRTTGREFNFIDMTIFSCSMTIAFIETCIHTGMIHSNSRHKDFFEMSSASLQILGADGEVIYTSESAVPITREDFKKLQTDKTTEHNGGVLLHMSPINGGYVAWSSDVSLIKSMITELEAINKRLFKEVDLLLLENEQKEEAARLKERRELQDVMLMTVLPYSERVKAEIMSSGDDATLEEMKRLLFETSMVSTYLKRKVNLVLTAHTESYISSDEMRRAFVESFLLLEFFGRSCGIHIADDYQLNLDTTLLCYDLYQAVIEKVDYNFESIFLSYNEREAGLVFSIEISGNAKIQPSDFECFTEKMTPLEAMLNFASEEDGDYLSIMIPK